MTDTNDVNSRIESLQFRKFTKLVLIVSEKINICNKNYKILPQSLLHYNYDQSKHWTHIIIIKIDQLKHWTHTYCTGTILQPNTTIEI